MANERDQSHSAARIIAAEEALAHAHVTLDIDQIDRLLHPGYVIVQPGGRVENKADVLASYRSGERRWDTATADEMVVHLYGQTAVIIGRWRARGVDRGRSFNYVARFASVWVLEEGAWRNVLSQSTELT